MFAMVKNEALRKGILRFIKPISIKKEVFIFKEKFLISNYQNYIYNLNYFIVHNKYSQKLS